MVLTSKSAYSASLAAFHDELDKISGVVGKRLLVGALGGGAAGAGAGGLTDGRRGALIGGVVGAGAGAAGMHGFARYAEDALARELKRARKGLISQAGKKLEPLREQMAKARASGLGDTRAMKQMEQALVNHEGRLRRDLAEEASRLHQIGTSRIFPRLKKEDLAEASGRPRGKGYHT